MKKTHDGGRVRGGSEKESEKEIERESERECRNTEMLDSAQIDVCSSIDLKHMYCRCQHSSQNFSYSPRMWIPCSPQRAFSFVI